MLNQVELYTQVKSQHTLSVFPTHNNWLSDNMHF